MNEQSTIPNNTEIDKALKEFEVKSAPSQAQQSSERTSIPQKDVEGVKFEVPSYGAVNYKETDTPKMVKLVMKLSGGAIKEQKQAEYFLLGFVVVAIIVSLFLFFGGKSNTPSVDIPVPGLSLPAI